jgi:EmrB/QacA subfamily drug resistance transporter
VTTVDTPGSAPATDWRARRARYEANPRYRWHVLIVLMVGVFSTAFPTTLLSASLPDIAHNLGTSTSVITWVQTAPAIAYAIGMPFFGKLGDLHGHRRAFIYGFACAAVAALLTACAWNAGSLIVIRTLGQLAGAATTTAAFGLIATVFAREERARAVGIYTSVLAMAPVLAVVAGGPLVEAIGWRTLFLIQAVPAIVAVFIAIPVLPESARRRATPFDAAGAIALGIGITAMLFAVNRGKPWGWSHPIVLGGFILGPIVLVAFVLIERNRSDPLLPLEFFGRRNFTAPIATNAIVQLSYIGGFTIAPFMVSRLFGYRTYKTALIIAIRPVCFSIGAWIAGRYERSIGARSIQVSSSAVLAAGSVVTAIAAWHESLPLVIVGLAVVGWGVGFGRPANTTAVTNAVDETDVGLATGVLNMMGQIGSAIGITLLLAIVGDSHDGAVFAHASLVGAGVAVASIATAAFVRSAPH